VVRTFDGLPPILVAGLRRRGLLREPGPQTRDLDAAVFDGPPPSFRSAPCPRRASVELYWLPLGAGDTMHLVRWNGRIFEALVALLHHRKPLDLYHSALAVRLDDDQFVLEMAPAWESTAADRGVTCEGPVGFRWLGRIRLFRYEVRRWRDGVIKDAAAAVGSPRPISTDPIRTQLLLNLVLAFPTATWGRDELATGEMWNSNSLISWLLARSHHDTDAIVTPAHGRAPGWNAGLLVATRTPGEPLALRGRMHLVAE
jgi:hypothetical protein